MSIEELGQVRTQSNLKTTINLTLVDEADFDIKKLSQHFDQEFFFIKISPININAVSDANNMGEGIIKGKNLV
jgi:23S rRNA (adenine2503-C2)-methyltransferase